MSYEPGDFRDTEIEVHRASAIGNKHVPTFSIVAHAETPEFKDLADAAAFYDAEATTLVAVLLASLPGGVIDRVLVRLLDHQASLLRVSHGAFATAKQR